MSVGPVRQSGIPAVGRVPWGTHVCQFYRSSEELVETLVPYFQAGLAGNERCLWITSEPFGVADAEAALRIAVPDLDRRIRSGQLEIIDHRDWYSRTDDPGIEPSLHRWLDGEIAARAAGYDGLRISGDTFWVERQQWDSLAGYEESVHRALHARRILALCSYTLAKCGSDDIIDVLRNHGFALVRRARRWEVVRSATLMLAAIDPDAERDNHIVRFFEELDYPADRIAEYLADGMQRGAAAAVFAAPGHLADMALALQRRGVDLAARRLTGQLIERDAAEAARAVVVDGEASPQAFNRVVGGPIRRALAGFGRVRAYGEIVDVLARAGDHRQAIELEHLWNALIDVERRSGSIELLCGYALDSFADASSGAAFQRVCGAHGQVEPVGGRNPGGDGRLLAELQQTSAALRSEASQRQEIERQRDAARAWAETAAAQLARLQEITAELSEVSTPAEVAAVVANALVDVFGAGIGGLLVPSDDGTSLRVLGHAGTSPDAPEVLRVIPVAAERPIAEAFRTGRPIWLTSPAAIAQYPEAARAFPEAHALAAVPLVLGGRRLGVIGLTFTDSYAPPPTERALLDDYARQIAVALDRARSYEEAQQARERAECEQRRAEAASRAKDEFLAMLGHELRNPLSPILTAVQLMRAPAANGHTRELGIIERQLRHVVRLVDDLLDISRIVRGVVELKRAPVEIRDIAASAVENVAPLIDERSQDLVVAVPAGLVIDGDADRLRQGVMNLLTNAARYTHRTGSVEITARAVDGWAQLTVRDNGNGIEPELLPHIFDLFVQGRQDPDRRQGGLGLGLAIARNLVELHGGTISAASDGAGQGSRFTIALPLLRPAEQSDGAAADPTQSAPQSRLRVLIVDDNQDGAEVLGMALERMGHEVRLAHDGASALELADEIRPDLALLDIGLPLMDGYEVATRLAGRADRPKLVAVTGYGQASDRARAAACGFDEHLVKPADLAQIRGVIARLFGLG